MPPEAHRHDEHSPAMIWPLVILAFGAVAVGGYLQWTGDFLSPSGFLAKTPSLAYERLHATTTTTAATAEGGFHWGVAVASTLAALAGIGLAAIFYLGSPHLAERLRRAMTLLGLYGMSRGKFFFDPIYQALIVRPLRALSTLSALVDRRLIDGLVDFVGRCRRLSGPCFAPPKTGSSSSTPWSWCWGYCC